MSPIGFGEHDDQRSRLLSLAGFPEGRLAEMVKQVIEKKVALLSAKKVVTAQHQGKILDEREFEDHRIQLEASKALDDILGIKAPPARQAVTIVHKIQLPDWMCPDEELPKIVDVTGQVEES